MKSDIQNEIVEKIVKALETAQANNWKMPWQPSENNGGLPVNAVGKAYRGINIMILWSAQLENGYSSNQWFGYNAAKELGGVKKGERATKILFFSFVDKEQKDGSQKKIPVSRVLSVFNAAQCNDYVVPEPVEKVEPEGRIEECDNFVINTGADIRYGGNRACFVPSQDILMMPEFEQFKTPEGYYSTMFHELGHWTGAKGRLERTFGSFGDEKYAYEELIAEMTSAFLCANFGIENHLQHPEYIKSWIKVLKNDTKFIFQAATAAQKAFDYLLNTSETEGTEDVE